MCTLQNFHTDVGVQHLPALMLFAVGEQTLVTKRYCTYLIVSGCLIVNSFKGQNNKSTLSLETTQNSQTQFEKFSLDHFGIHKKKSLNEGLYYRICIKHSRHKILQWP